MTSAMNARLEEARRDVGVRSAARLLCNAAGMKCDDSSAARLEPIVDDLFSTGIDAAPADVRVRVAGEPVLDRGFSRAVGENQVKSTILAVVVVLLLLFGLFRSWRSAVTCWLPALLTLGLIFGTMGILGIHVDLGTSMVAGIATGAGSDFAMHYMWYLRRQSPEDVSRTVGPVMVVAVLVIAAGFLVLALGRSPVMRLFGCLTTAAMVLSMTLTCLLIPAFLPKSR
jgi:predicted RND superfamily exporter protein